MNVVLRERAIKLGMDVVLNLLNEDYYDQRSPSVIAEASESNEVPAREPALAVASI